MWSPGTGTQVWEIFCAASNGNVERPRTLLNENPALVRCHYIYRAPLYFAVRENQIDAVRLRSI